MCHFMIFWFHPETEITQTPECSTEFHHFSISLISHGLFLCKFPSKLHRHPHLWGESSWLLTCVVCVPQVCQSWTFQNHWGCCVNHCKSLNVDPDWNSSWLVPGARLHFFCFGGGLDSQWSWKLPSVSLWSGPPVVVGYRLVNEGLGP